MGKRRPGVSEDLMSNTAEEWKNMLAAPEVVSVKREHKSPLPPKKIFQLSMPHSFNSLMLIPQLCIAHCAGSSWPFGL